MANDKLKRFRRPPHWTLAQTLAHYSAPRPNGCRLWRAYQGRHGYGLLRWNGLQLAHRLAWESVNGPVPDGQCVCHKCDVPSCVNPGHLWLGTKADNNADMVAKGRQARVCGERNGNAKLTDTQVRAIYRAPDTQREIAARFNVDQALVGRIKTGKIWRHLHMR